MDKNIDIEKLIHEARMLSIQGKQLNAIANYNVAINSVIDELSTASDEDKTKLQSTLSMYLEEADAVKSLYQGSGSADSGFCQTSESVPIIANPTSSSIPINKPTDSSFWGELGNIFSEFGNNIREFDDEYKISENCTKFAKDVSEKAIRFAENAELERHATEMQEKVKRWSEENHISEHFQTALDTVAEATSHLLDPLTSAIPGSVTTPNPMVFTPVDENVYTTTESGNFERQPGVVEHVTAETKEINKNEVD